MLLLYTEAGAPQQILEKKLRILQKAMKSFQKQRSGVPGWLPTYKSSFHNHYEVETHET
jgi:hypothetical protein